MGSLRCVQVVTLFSALGLKAALNSSEQEGDRGRAVRSSSMETQEGPDRTVCRKPRGSWAAGQLGSQSYRCLCQVRA